MQSRKSGEYSGRNGWEIFDGGDYVKFTVKGNWQKVWLLMNGLKSGTWIWEEPSLLILRYTAKKHSILLMQR
jgi:hypothetical protein